MSGKIQWRAITGRCAQNREVFAVPGNITSRNSFGTNYLIKGAGARLVQVWQDVAAKLPPDIAARLFPPARQKKTEEKGLVEELGIAPDDLSATEQAVFKLLSTGDPAHIDALAGASKLSVPELTGAPLALERRELTRQLPGRCFVRKL